MIQKSIGKLNPKQIFYNFKKTFNHLLDWSTQWQLKFNISKCHILHLGPSHSYRDYYLDGNKITTESSVRDLGVTIDNCLKFHNHTNLTITKANCILGLISKIFQYKEPDMIIKLNKSLVRPIVEYGNPVWGPYYIIDQRFIEGLQRRATKLVPSIRHHTYPERLQILNLPSLFYRRYRGDMILKYQVTHKNIDGSLLNLFKVAPVSATRGHNLKFLSTVVLLATELIHFPLDLSINGTNYRLILLMLALPTVLKIYKIIFVLMCYLLLSSYTHMHIHNCCRSGFYRLSAFYPVIH